MATMKSFLILLSLTSATLAAERTPASVRILEEKSMSDLLQVEVETADRFMNFTLQKRLVLSPALYTFIDGPNGSISIGNITNGKFLELYEDDESGARFYKNSKKQLEGMVSHKLALRHENDQHFVMDIVERENDEHECVTCDNPAHGDSDDHRSPKIQPQKSTDQSDRESTKFTVELAILVDSAMYANFYSWFDLYAYLTVFWKVVDNRYNTLRDLDVNIALTSVLISPTVYFDQYFVEFIDNERIDAYKSIEKLGRLIYSVKCEMLDFDALQLQTGYDLAGWNSITGGLQTNYIGIAYVESACESYMFNAINVGIAEDDACYTHVRSSAHELAHNLGAPHDGFGRASYCSWSGGYIMSYIHDSYRSTLFSSCSAAAIKSYYDRGSEDSCLRTISNTHYIQYSDDYPGRYRTLTQQCQDRTGDPYAVYDYTVSSYVQCIQLRCILYRGWSTYHYRDFAPALEGSRCPSGGFCSNGRCVSDLFPIWAPFENEEKDIEEDRRLE